jgi:Family of unknown function (DUF5329)
LRFQAQLRGFLKALALAVLVACAAPAQAAGLEAEIQHLLDFIAASPCAFIRNGVAHDGKEAVGHIKDKYDYYRDDIHSAEDFIALAASKSAMTGKPYLVECGGATEPAADWITRELDAFRHRPGS